MSTNFSKSSRWYMVEILLDGAIRCKDKGVEYQYVEDRYLNQVIGYTFALNTMGAINGSQFKDLIDRVNHRYYETAKGVYKNILQGE